jgi:subtilisin family serine protease
VVAMLDTGVDYRHPDLAANMWINPGETGLDANGRDRRRTGSTTMATVTSTTSMASTRSSVLEIQWIPESSRRDRLRLITGPIAQASWGQLATMVSESLG